MKFKEYVLMALRDLSKRKGRTFLTSLGITIGTLLIVTMVGLGTGVQNFMTATVNDEDNARSISVMPMKYFTDEEADQADMSTFEEDYFKKIDDEFIQKIKDTDRAETIVAAINYAPDTLKFSDKEYSGNINCVGYNEEANVYPDYIIERVRHDEEDDSLNPLKAGTKVTPNVGEIVIGEELLSQLKLTEEQVLNNELELVIKSANGMEIPQVSKKLKVVGIIDKHFSDGKKLVLDAKDVAELKGYSTIQKDYMGNKGYDSVEIAAKDVSNVEPLTEKIKELGYYSTSSIEMAKSVEETLDGVNTAFAVLGIIVLVVAAIGIVNTMSMAVLERTRSIGVMKSLGADCNAIRTIFLVQSSLIGLIGGLVGTGLGMGINAIAQMVVNSKIIEESMNATISVGLPWYWLLIILGFAVVIALISGIYPANRASKLDPIEALRR
jgi:putative ABC transport system permease protein